MEEEVTFLVHLLFAGITEWSVIVASDSVLADTRLLWYDLVWPEKNPTRITA